MYKLPKLTHMYRDFEPFIDTHTMGVHCYKHEQTYLNERGIYIDSFKNIADFTNASLIYDKIV